MANDTLPRDWHTLDDQARQAWVQKNCRPPRQWDAIEKIEGIQDRSEEGFTINYCRLCKRLTIVCPRCGLSSCSGGGCDVCNPVFDEADSYFARPEALHRRRSLALSSGVPPQMHHFVKQKLGGKLGEMSKIGRQLWTEWALANGYEPTAALHDMLKELAEEDYNPKLKCDT